MDKINDGGRAFPWCGDLNQTPFIELGMTLRDYFAAKAMREMNWDYPDKSAVATECYAIADAMLRARGEA